MCLGQNVDVAAEKLRAKGIEVLAVVCHVSNKRRKFARSVPGLPDATSTEFDLEIKTPCVIFMPEGSKTHMGGTMRLGSTTTYFQVTDCKSAKWYGNVSFVDKRHRHRYEVNPDMVSQLESVGLSFVDKDETGIRMEIVELPGHPFYIGVQFHPEFKSIPGKPSPLFSGLMAAATSEPRRTVMVQSNGHTKLSNEVCNGYSPILKAHQNGNGFISSNGSLNVVYTNGNGVYVDGSC